jgi:hypothetical protein
VRAIRSRLTFANVAAGIALFVALGTGTAFALNVDSKDVDNNSLKSKDLKNGKGVKCEDVVPGEPICQPAGDGGGGGEVVGGGGDGVGLTNTTVRSNTGTTDPGTGLAEGTASCAAGERATGGGFDVQGGATPRAEDVRHDRPQPASGTPTGWTVRVQTFSASAVLTVYVVCAS